MLSLLVLAEVKIKLDEFTFWYGDDDRGTMTEYEGDDGVVAMRNNTEGDNVGKWDSWILVTLAVSVVDLTMGRQIRDEHYFVWFISMPTEKRLKMWHCLHFEPL